MKQMKVYALAALPLVIIAVFGLDTWLYALHQVAGESFDMRPIVTLTPVIDVLYAALILLLVWLVNGAQDWRVGLVYVGVGALLIAYPVLKWQGWSLIRSLPLTPVIGITQRGLWLHGAFVIMIGLWGILTRRVNREA